jgi:hypothetical protein
MTVQENLNLIPHGRPNGLDLTNRQTGRLARFQSLPTGQNGQVPAEKPPSCVKMLSAGFHKSRNVLPVSALDVGIADNPVPAQAAEKLIQRDTQRLALDIPQRDVDGRKRGRVDMLRRKKAAPEEGLPDVFDPKWIATDQEGPKLLHSRHDGRFPVADSSLSNPGDTLVCLNLYKKVVAITSVVFRGPDWIAVDGSDLHLGLLY